MRNKYTSAQRQRWVSRWRASGISAEKFCRGKAFSPSTLYNWHSKTEVEVTTMVPVEIINNVSSPVRIIYPNGIIVEMDQGTNTELIKSLLQC